MEVKVKKLKDARRDAFYSMQDLANKSGISLSTITRLESGRTGAHPSTVRKLAEALEVEPHDLAFRESDED